MNTEVDGGTTDNYRLSVDYYGADFPVEVLVKRMEDGDFIIPGFQRKYVWNDREASRFIESLLMGLPTPALFLAKDKFSNQYLVIDGQQRLKTLQYFYSGRFPNDKPFKLKGVSAALNGFTYSELTRSEQRALSNSIIHCIIISDNYDPAGMFHLFERLNTTGTPLKPQEVRNAIYHGPFSELLQTLSTDDTWRQLYGLESSRAEEQELILRFLALHYEFETYSGNLVEFLNQFMLKNQLLDSITGREMSNVFLRTIHFLRSCIDTNVFIHNKSFNRVLFDTLTLLVAKNLGNGLNCERFRQFYESLINDEEFWAISRQATTSKKNLNIRMQYVKSLYARTAQ